LAFGSSRFEQMLKEAEIDVYASTLAGVIPIFGALMKAPLCAFNME
jgi:hypothetical protein